MRTCFVLLAAALCFAPAANPAHARPFDLVYADRVDVSLCEGCGITLAELGFGILVNTGPVSITHAELNAAQFSCVSSVPGISMTPFLTVQDSASSALAAGHARGPGLPLFLPLLAPGEVLDDTYAVPRQFLAFSIDREFGTTYAGPVNFHVTMQLVEAWIEFDILAQVSLSDFSIQFTHATRQSAISPPVAARSSTWGAIKSLYR